MSEAARARDTVTRWWWVRHAVVTIHQGRIYGQDDLPCVCEDADLFAAQARRLPAEALWVTSNLMRTHQTATALVAAGAAGPGLIPGPDARIEPDLAEQHFGSWQGQTNAALMAAGDRVWHRFWLAPAIEAPPGGESFVAVMDRVRAVIERYNREHAGRDIVAIAHGGTIRAALALALDLTPEAALAFSIDNVSLTRLDRFDGPSFGHAWRVGGVNMLPGGTYSDRMR